MDLSFALGSVFLSVNILRGGDMKGFLMESSIPAGQGNNQTNVIYFDNDLSHYYDEIQLDRSEIRNYCNTRRLNSYNNAKSVYSSYHIYQRSHDKSNIFHSGKDALVFISIVKLKAMKLGVAVYAICLMDNHIHMLVKVRDRTALRRFVTDYTSMFAKAYNKRYKRDGLLFSSPYGRAYKKTDKYVRNCISYINNNPVEAGKTKNIEEYMWNMFSFGRTSHPHSEALNMSKSRYFMRCCCRSLRSEYSRGRYTSYELLDELFSRTDKKETEQLLDYILDLYNPVDYSAMYRLFGSFDKAALAMNSYTGSEYDITEDDRL